MRKSGAMSGYARRLAGAGMPLVWLALASGAAHAETTAGADTSAALKTMTKAYCVKCHNTEDWAGGVAMDTLDLDHVGKNQDIWEAAVNKLRGRLMPPAGQKQPAQTDVDAVVGFLETSIDSSQKQQRIGYVPIQRLSRAEFAASIKSLIGADIDARKALPTEVEVDGFTNIASALAVSPSFMEQYLSTVRHAVQLAVGEPVPKMAKVTIPVTPATAADFPLGTRGGSGRGGGVSFNYVFPADGEYRFSVPAEDYLDMGLYPRGAQYASTMVILVDGVEVVRKILGGPEYLNILDRDGPAGAKTVLGMVASTAQVKAGEHHVVMTFIDRSRALSNDATGGGGGPFGGGGHISDMPIIQTAVEVEGPFDPHGLSMNPSRAKIYVCEPKNAADERPCAESIARHMATEAFRRPATDADVKAFMPFYENARKGPGGFDAGITELVTAILSSPDFLYRSIPAPEQANASRPLTDLELASRLSFLMWNTGPDRELIDLAAAHRLSDPAVMDAQVARMLKDPRANALVEDFALSWLNLDDLGQIEPTDRSWNDGMRSDFETEIRMFVASVLLEDRSVTELLNADWTFVNEDLARQYGIRGVHGSQFRRVTLTDQTRFGLLGKGAVLLATSYSDRTSPVRRGAWVLDKLMGTPPAQPPPNVVTDLSVKEGQPVTTVRARLELHRTNPTCKACHGLIDPFGLALENFDNTGRWRVYDQEARATIDPKSELSSGALLDGPTDVRRYLDSHPDQFPTTVTRRLMTYALNRELEYYDMPEVRRIVHAAARSNYRFSAIIDGVVNSDAFRRQGSEPPAKTPEKIVASNSTTAANPPAQR
jgi:Protein of unknown function (DUF1592)/Protein of unknown function (DUF1588)/Protein of unknown function (DUF1585)/Protein of unknown function (DUF1595)/Protein of unknown function (DUF1587)